MKNNDNKDNTAQKPETTPLFRYYFIEPIQSLGWEVSDTLKCLWRWLSGTWYCDHCKKYHGRRVTKYSIKPSPIEKLSEAIAGRTAKDLQVCSLGRDAELQRQAKAESETVYNEDQAN